MVVEGRTAAIVVSFTVRRAVLRSWATVRNVVGMPMVCHFGGWVRGVLPRRLLLCNLSCSTPASTRSGQGHAEARELLTNNSEGPPQSSG